MAKKRKSKEREDGDLMAIAKVALEASTEAELWVQGYAVMARAVIDRRPDANDRVKAEIHRLDNQISATANRRELAAQAGAKPQARVLMKEIEMLSERMKLVSRLARRAAKPKGLPREDGPTPETAVRPAIRDIIALLEGLHEKGNGEGGISPQQAEAARRIAQINEAISAAGQVKAVNFEGAGGGKGGEFRDIALAGKLDELRSRKYLPWCAHLNSAESTRVTLDIVIKVAVYNHSLRKLEQRHRLRNGSGIVKLREGLDAFINQSWVPSVQGALTLQSLEA